MKSIIIFLILSQIFTLKPLNRKSLARNGTEEIANNNATNPETVNNSTEIVLPAVIKTEVPEAKNPVVVPKVVNRVKVLPVNRVKVLPVNRVKVLPVNPVEVLPVNRKSLAKNGTEEIANNNATNPETVNNSTEIVLPAVIKTDVPGAKNPVVVPKVVNRVKVPLVVNPVKVLPVNPVKVLPVNRKSLARNEPGEIANNNATNPETVNNSTEIVLPAVTVIATDVPGANNPVVESEPFTPGPTVWYWENDPIYYSDTPYSSYHDCNLSWDPVFCGSYYRKNQLKAGNNLKSDKKNERTALNTEDIEKQIKSLKKEIFGKENYSTKELRKNNKAYDPRWLVAQLKVARLLFLEDEINKNRK